jgi:PAS domain S-box-containing protein
MYGWTESDALGKVTHDFLHTGGELSNAAIDEILHREGRWDGELNHIARDGRRLIVESRQVLVRDGKNEPVGILEINRDITGRKLAEAVVRQASEQRGLAFEAANLVAWEYRLDTGNFLRDEQYATLFGDPIGNKIAFDDFLSRIHPDDRAPTKDAVQQAIAGANDGVYDREFRVVWPDGSVHWVASHGRVFFEGDGDRRRAARFLGVGMDITERRHAEERLRQTQKLESIGLLAGGVAHDFNNLLTVIMGSASLAHAECPACEHTQAILSASERAAYLTKQLLAYAGKGQAIVRIVDLTEIVSQAETLLAVSVPKRVKLGFHLSKDLPCLEADPSQIEQILMNLVVNAGEAITPQCDGLIEIAVSSCEVAPDLARERSKAYDVAPGSYVCLEVRDNGAGMDEAMISRIFDPFFTTKFTGRGLGLAAVHGIVRTSKGFIDVHSSPGAGTTFRVFLPASGKTRAKAPEPSAPRQQIRGAATILVVDDEEMVRKLASTTLRQHGYEVLEATDGRDALQMLSGAKPLPSLVLLDLTMPVMGGDELVPVLEREYPGLKIVVSSGYPEEDARKGFASGSIAGFLQKPYTVMTLAEKIAEALGGPTRNG